MYGSPVAVDYYKVYGSESPYGSFQGLDDTGANNFTHENALIHFPDKYSYYVTGFKTTGKNKGDDIIFDTIGKKDRNLKR